MLFASPAKLAHPLRPGVMTIGVSSLPAFSGMKGENFGNVGCDNTVAKAASVCAWKTVAEGNSRPNCRVISANIRSAVHRLPPRLKKLSSTPKSDRLSIDRHIGASFSTIAEADAELMLIVESNGAMEGEPDRLIIRRNRSGNLILKHRQATRDVT